MTRLPAAFLARPIAHRGLHDRKGKVIENSLSAIRAAAAAGYGIEIDLQCSADGEAICFHDDDLQRLTGEPGAVREWRSEDLAEIGLKGGGGDLVPSFAQALEAAGDVPLLVEIKRQGPEIAAGKLEFRAASLIAEHVAAGRGPVAVMSFDPRSVAWFHQHAPEIPRGLVSMDWDRDDAGGEFDPETRRDMTRMASFEPSEADFFSYRWRDLPTPRTRALRDAGVPALCWTTRSPEEHATARRHADNVTFEGYVPES